MWLLGSPAATITSVNVNHGDTCNKQSQDTENYGYKKNYELLKVWLLGQFSEVKIKLTNKIRVLCKSSEIDV